jgi:hypothetical protein
MYSCKFYGKCAVPSLQVLRVGAIRQCGLIEERYAPCRMEVRGQHPDFNLCELNGTMRAAAVDSYKDEDPQPRPA